LQAQNEKVNRKWNYAAWGFLVVLKISIFFPEMMCENSGFY